MTESTTELFNNFKGTLNDYTANAFGIGVHMKAFKTALDADTKEYYKESIRKNINEEIKLEKDLDEYIKALSTSLDFYIDIIDDVEKLRSMSYSAGKVYYITQGGEDYGKCQDIYTEEHNKMIKKMEEELENA